MTADVSRHRNEEISAAVVAAEKRIAIVARRCEELTAAAALDTEREKKRREVLVTKASAAAKDAKQTEVRVNTIAATAAEMATWRGETEKEIAVLRKKW